MAGKLSLTFNYNATYREERRAPGACQPQARALNWREAEGVGAQLRQSRPALGRKAAPSLRQDTFPRS